MKNASFLPAMISILFLAVMGCRTKQPAPEAAPNSVSINTPAPTAGSAETPAPTSISAAHPRIRVESIPNPQLTPTSREGDQPGPVYSRNIIAVYIDTNGVGTSNYTWDVVNHH